MIPSNKRMTFPRVDRHRGRLSCQNRTAQKKSPRQRGLGGAWRLGLLIFETQTHPVTINSMIDAQIKFQRMIVKSVNLNQLPLRLLSKRRPTMTIENDGLREDLRAWLISPAIGLPEYSADLKVQR